MGLLGAAGGLGGKVVSGRLSVLVVAGARSAWSGAVARWAAGAVLPVDVVRCLSLDEARARLASGRPWSALLVDGALPSVDRDLVATARNVGCPTLVVDEVGGRDLHALGAAAVIGTPFSRDELLGLLESHGRRVPDGMADVVPRQRQDDGAPRGTAIGIIGAGGTGTSTVAAALAQGLARTVARRRRDQAARPRRDVLLADLCRFADQATMHDARTLVPGLREVVDAHRTSTPSAQDLRAQTFVVPERGYHLLLGLRRPSHWTTLPPRATDAALDGLLAAFEVVVADLDPDLEGEGVTGSYDVEERHHLSRAMLTRADVVVVTADPSVVGCAKAVHLVADVVELGVTPDRVLLACSRAPRSPRARAEVVRALADLLQAGLGTRAHRIAAPLALPHRPVEAAVRDGVPLPAPLPDKLAAAVTTLLARVAPVPDVAPGDPQPVLPAGVAAVDEPDRGAS